VTFITIRLIANYLDALPFWNLCNWSYIW